MKPIYALLCAMLLGAIVFTADPPPRPAQAASGVIVITSNCAVPSPAPSSGQQATYVDQNGLVCVSPFTKGCAGATTANTATKPFSNNASATSLKLVTGVASQIVHVCAINVGPVAGAVNVAMIEGTRNIAPCDTGTLGIAGGATAATGWILPINGSVQLGDGQGIIAQAVTTGNDVCLAFSAAVQVSGVITYAIY